MSDNVYDSLAETHEDGQWAFGTGFEDVQEEITAPVPTASTPPTSRSTASCSATTR